MAFIEKLKKFRFGYLLLAILLCTCGMLIIIYPNESMTTVSYIIGAITLIGGIVQVIKILADRRRGAGFAFSIITAAVTVIAAIVALIFPGEVMTVYPMIIGLFIVIDGAFKLHTVINSKRYKMKMWWLLLIIACIAILGGFLCIRVKLTDDNFAFFSFVLGASITVCGIQNLLSLFYLGNIVKRASIEYEKHATDISDDAVIADSYPSEDPKKIKEDILPLENKENIVEVDFEEETEKEKIEE